MSGRGCTCGSGSCSSCQSRVYRAKLKADPERWAAHLARAAEVQRRFRERHPEAMKDYRRANRERLLDAERTRIAADREARREKTRAYRAANAEKVREQQRAYREANPLKARAWIVVRNELKRGRLQRGQCEVCGTTEHVHAHHDDYTKPLDIRWLCREHHGQAHWKAA